MPLLATLVIFPCVVAALLLIFRAEGARKPIVYGASVILMILAIVTCALYLGQGTRVFEVPHATTEIVSYVFLAIDVLLCVYLVAKGVRHKQWLVVVLAVLQLAAVLYLELVASHGVIDPTPLYVDTLTLVMVLIICIIGSGICIYALGYMQDYQEHRSKEGGNDRRHLFFAIMFAFLGAMNLLVMAGDMRWLLCGWEVTTVCSFVLIGYSQDEASIKNAFTQITLNLIGGLCFTAAVIISSGMSGIVDLQEFIDFARLKPVLSASVALLCVAGLIKAAQMPVHHWLLGAMVAPTPTSALLHSSTMVKAGVFLLIKLSPVLNGTIAGGMVVLIGSASFLISALCAISQRNAKRVLAYSTISNLGLIAACAGLGTAEATWAAIFLLVFHALAKSLLFCCVGTAEHHIGSRDIESMDLLFERMPRLARYMLLGAMCMFIAPFGMLISKWAALSSLIQSGHIIAVFLVVFGSAATFIFWAKWLGKLVGATGQTESVEASVHKSEWVFLTLALVLALAACITIPLLSRFLVSPYLMSVFPGATPDAISSGNLILLAVMSICIIVVVATIPKKRGGNVYLSGVSANNDQRLFVGSFDSPQKAEQSNWYMTNMFPEKKLDRLAIVAGVVLLVAGVALSCYISAVGSTILTFLGSGVM